MKYDELPLLIKPIDVSRITGLKARQVRSLGDTSRLKFVTQDCGYRMYLRESLKEFVNVKGHEKVPQ